VISLKARKLIIALCILFLCFTLFGSGALAQNSTKITRLENLQLRTVYMNFVFINKDSLITQCVGLRFFCVDSGDIVILYLADTGKFFSVLVKRNEGWIGLFLDGHTEEVLDFK